MNMIYTLFIHKFLSVKLSIYYINMKIHNVTKVLLELTLLEMRLVRCIEMISRRVVAFVCCSYLTVCFHLYFTSIFCMKFTWKTFIVEINNMLFTVAVLLVINIIISCLCSTSCEIPSVLLGHRLRLHSNERPRTCLELNCSVVQTFSHLKSRGKLLYFCF